MLYALTAKLIVKTTSDSSQSSVFASLAVSLAIFLPFWAWAQFPYLVDEYYFLAARSSAAGVHLDDFRTYVPLRPWFALINFLTFKTGLIDYGKLLILIYFAIHAVSFGLLFQYFLKATGVELTKQKKLLWLGATVPMILFPSNYELHLMVLNLPYTLGLLALALGVPSSRRSIQVLGLWAAFLALETYVLPGAVLLGLPATWSYLKKTESKAEPGKDRLKTWLKALLGPVLTFLTAYILFLGTTRLLSFWTGYGIGDRAELLHFTSAQLLTRLKLMTGFIWHLHFYKAYWLATVIQWCVFLAIAISAYQRKTCSRAQLVFLFLLPFLAGAHYLIVPYYAPRAVYGAVEIKNLAIGFLLFLSLSVETTNRKWIAPSILLACHLAVLGIIFSIKSQNFVAIQKTEDAFVEQLTACNVPCALEVPAPNQGLKRDWMMVSEYYEAFYRWAAARRVPGKTFSVKIVESDPKLAP